MIRVILLLLIFLIISCSNNKSVFWCGDHACINKKEKESYFKKNMTVEIKEINIKNKDNKSKNEKILKQLKKDQKRELNEEKILAKEIKLEEKKKLREEKILAKKIKLDKKKRLKDKKTLVEKKTTSTSIEPSSEVKTLSADKTQKVNLSGTFDEIKVKIVEKNLIKRYPNINDIPN